MEVSYWLQFAWLIDLLLLLLGIGVAGVLWSLAHRIKDTLKMSDRAVRATEELLREITTRKD